MRHGAQGINRQVVRTGPLAHTANNPREVHVITSRHVIIWLASLALAGCQEPSEPTATRAPSLAAAGNAGSSAELEDAPVLTIDHQVSHVSTVPANSGE